MAAPGSECSSGCQSGWTTYLDDDDDDRSSYSCDDTSKFHGMPQQRPCYGCDDYSQEEQEDDDLSMVSDASSGPRQQHSADARAVRRGGMVAEPARPRRQSKMASAVASSTLLEDTASSPAFFMRSTQVMGSPEANGYGGGAAGSMMEMSSAADFSCAFFAASTGFEFQSSPLMNVSRHHLGGYLKVPAAAVKPMLPSVQVCRDGGDKIQRW